MEVGVEVAVLGLVPVVGGGVVVGAEDGGAAGRGPVLGLGVVEAELEALLAALFGELAEGVALEGGGGDDVEGVGFGVEHGEAVVVLGGDDDVLHAGGFGEGDDVVGGEGGGVEAGGEGFVVGDGDGGVVHDPLADAGDVLAVPGAGGDGVEAPVDEHAEAGLAPPFHAGVALGGGFGVLDGGDGMGGGGGDAVAFELGVSGGGEEEAAAARSGAAASEVRRRVTGDLEGRNGGRGNCRSEMAGEEVGDVAEDAELGGGGEPVAFVGEEVGGVGDVEAGEEGVELVGVGDGDDGVGIAVEDEGGREGGGGGAVVGGGEAAGDLDDGAEGRGRGEGGVGEGEEGAERDAERGRCGRGRGGGESGGR